MPEGVEYLNERARRLQEQMARLPVDSGGGPPHDGGMEARIAKLEALAESTDHRLSTIETDMREIRDNSRSDFRITWGGLIAATLGLAGLMAKGFGWL